MRHYDCATMASTVKGLLAADKGILAADESFPKIAKRFAAITDVPKVVEATVRCLLRSVPAAIPGIVFLSGGQNDEAATQRLNAICRVNDVPWTLSFSFERALQAPSLKILKGSQDNVAAAQAALHHRAKCNGLARDLVNRQAGLLGVSGISSDMRDLLAKERENPRAAEAVALFCYQAKKFFGALTAVLGGLDTLIFTAGIGESAPLIRWRICEGMEFLGIR